MFQVVYHLCLVMFEKNRCGEVRLTGTLSIPNSRTNSFLIKED
jgi:hypothetical protein